MNHPLTCEMTLLVQAEFDGELDATEAARVSAHRAACAVCRAAYANMEKVRATLRQPDAYQPAPEGLRAKLAQARPVRGAWWKAGTMGFGAGAAIAATIALMFMPAQAPLIDSVVAGHVRSLQPGHLQDVASSDQHTVKPWFDGRIDFAPPVWDFAASGYPLQGGRLDYLDGRPVAALVYGRDKHLINVFVWPAKDAPESAASARNGYNVIHMVHDGMNFWLVSDVERTQLAELARLLQTAP